MLTDDVTLIIPTTHTRRHLFERTLEFLSAGNCPLRIIVSDHRPPRFSGVVADLLRRYPSLQTDYRQHPEDLHFLLRLSDCARVAETPLVHLHADDDFLAPGALPALIEVMADRTTAAAMGINIHVSAKTGHVSISRKGEVRQPSPVDRLIAQLEAFTSVLYALRRRDEFITTLEFSASRCPDVQFWQYLESCLTALAGNIAVIDQLHYIRTTHEDKWSASLFHGLSPEHFPYLLLAPDFSAKLQRFRDAILEATRTASVQPDPVALDNGLIHLFHHGFTAMGLPKAQWGRDHIATRHAAQEQALRQLFGDAGQPDTQAMQFILELLNPANARPSQS